MDTPDQKQKWASKNKKLFVREFFRNVEFSGSIPPVGIFMAGLPGVGKTEFTKELMKELDEPPLRMDMDEIAEKIEGYKPQAASEFRGAASILLSRIFDEALKNNIDFLFDGTFSHKNAISNVVRARDGHGYVLKLYFIYQEPRIAWAFTKDREIVEHRGIGRDGFIQSYLNMYENLKTLQEEYKDVTISMIIKDQHNKEGRRIEDVDNVFDHIPTVLTFDQLSDIIE